MWRTNCLNFSKSSESPKIVITNIMVHELAPCIESRWGFMERYLARIGPYLDELNKLSDLGVVVIWKSTNPVMYQLWIPLSLLQLAMSTEKIQVWNEKVEKLLLERPNIHLWTSAENYVSALRRKCMALPKVQWKRVNESFVKAGDCGDGFHFGEDVFESELRIFLNFACNQFVYKDSCCS